MLRKLVVTLILTLVVMPAVVLADPKPLPPSPKEIVPQKLTSNQAQRLRQAWEKDGMPTIEVVVGQEESGGIVMKNSATELKLRAAVQEQLRLGIDAGRLVDTTALRTQQLHDLRSIAAQRGQNAADTLAEIMRDSGTSGLIMMVRLRPIAGGKFSVTMETVDPAMASAVASKSFLNLRNDADVSRVNAYACSIVSHFLKQYADRVLSPSGALYTYRLRVIGLNNDEDADTLAYALKQVDSVVGRVEYNWEYVKGGIGYGSYTVSIRESDPLMLVREFRKAVKDEMPGRAFFASRSGRGSMVGSILEQTTPRWWTLTDTSDTDTLAKARDKRETTKGLSRRLRLAVVIGPDLESPAAMAEDRTINLKREFDDSVLKSELESMFRYLGFDAVDDISLKEAKDLAQEQISRFKNLDNLEFAAEDKNSFEYLLYGNLAKTESGKRYEFRLIDRQSGTVVGTQRWPDSRVYNSAPKYHIRAEDPTGVARYVAGQLIQQLDARLLDKRLVMEVVVKNVEDIVNVAALADTFKKVPNVRSVGSYNYSMPIGGFEIVYEGSSDSLMEALRTELPKLDLPMLVDAYGDSQIVVNLRRKPIAQPDIAKAPRINVPDIKPTPASTPKSGTGATPNTPASISSPNTHVTLPQHLNAVGNSVCVIGIEVGSKFYPSGTGWTAGPDLLATNAHVVEGLKEGLKKLDDGRAIARRGDKLDIVMELGEWRVHPSYTEWDKFMNSVVAAKLIQPFDVALIKVSSGNAGTPLQLANSQQMERLLPGESVGYVGFPMEGKVNVLSRPSIMRDVGTLSAYTDQFLQPRNATVPGILHYTLRTRGGASGSPVFSSDGRVIAVHSAGDATRDVALIPVEGYVRQVVDPNGQGIEIKERLIFANLSEPGVPVAQKDGNVLVRLDSGSQRPLKEGQEKLVSHARELSLMDSNGVLQATLKPRGPRINVGFSYGQSIVMLKELLDGTAGAKQRARKRKWREQAAALRILKN